MKSDKELIINSIKEHLNFKNDKDFAAFLGIKQNTLSTWKSRNAIDYDLIIAKCDFIDANWLLTGKGNMLKKSSSQYNSAGEDASASECNQTKYGLQGEIDLSNLNKASKGELIEVIKQLIRVNNRNSISIEKMAETADRNSITLSKLVDVLHGEGIKEEDQEMEASAG